MTIHGELVFALTFELVTRHDQGQEKRQMMHALCRKLTEWPVPLTDEEFAVLRECVEKLLEIASDTDLENWREAA